MRSLKKSHRAEIRARLSALSSAARASASAVIAARLRALPAWNAARTVGWFAPLESEPDPGWPEPFPDSSPRRIALPRLIDGDIELRLLETPAALLSVRTPQGWILREPPASASPVDLSEIDLIVVPGLAFDRAGRRLGRGGGWYDRLLSRLPESTLCVGLFFAAQELAEIAEEPHDRPLNLILTEREKIEGY